MLRDQEPSSLSPHIEPAKVPLPHCRADFLLYIKLAHELCFALIWRILIFFSSERIMEVTKSSPSELLSIM